MDASVKRDREEGSELDGKRARADDAPSSDEPVYFLKMLVSNIDGNFIPFICLIEQ